jgi:hypothetical protein
VVVLGDGMIAQIAQVAQYAMWGAAVCYAVAAAGYAAEGKMWMGLTMVLYSTTCFTVWMAGTK